LLFTFSLPLYSQNIGSPEQDIDSPELKKESPEQETDSPELNKESPEQDDESPQSFAAESSSESIEPQPTITTSHAIAIHSQPKYAEDFEQFSYTSPLATKGGKLRLFGLGTFDSLNKYIAKGNPGIVGDPGYALDLIYDSLMVRAWDEPTTQYGLVAQTVEYPDDYRWITFHLREGAYFHDGKAITPEDIVFSFNLLLEKGSPVYKFAFKDVEQVIALEPNKVKFEFNENVTKDLLLAVGSLPIFPKHFWQDKEFNQSSLDIPLGSGPYKIVKVDPGKSLLYERVKNYWAQDLAVNRGFYNFDNISVDYYRDWGVGVEALKAGEFDYRWENSSKYWATAYDVPSVKEGRLIKREVAHQANSGVQAFAFNIRRPIFQDIELRKAISYAFDFEWSNQTLFYQAYQRSYSYFTNSVFAAKGLPTAEELEILKPYRDQLPESVFTEAYEPPVTDGSGRNRPNLRIAKKILDDAGYKVKDNVLYNKDGQAIKFEILLRSPGFERIVNPFIKSLSKLGIIARIRLVDTSQYVNRTRKFDFDMMVMVFSQSESPGIEQEDYWGSKVADTEDSRNIIGIKNPVIDDLIQNVINAKSREDLIKQTRILDRVLLHHHYVIPQWYKPSSRIVYWNKFGIPQISAKYDQQHNIGIYTWWYDEEKAQQLENNNDN
jgi:microcin C transport system substrate-binding protein